MAFRLKCRNKFYKTLGQFDAICEFTEVAVRDFLSNVKSEPEFNDLLAEKSILHKIKVNAVELNLFRSRIAQSYILSVYQSLGLVRSPSLQLPPSQRRISVSDLMQMYSTMLDTTYTKTPETTRSVNFRLA
jgi:hypothetical protein